MLFFTPCTAHSLLTMKSPLPLARKAWSLGCWLRHGGTGSRMSRGDAFAIAKPNAAIKPCSLAQCLPAGSRLAAAPAPLANAPGREVHASTQLGLPASEGEPGSPQAPPVARLGKAQCNSLVAPKELVVSPPQTGSRFPGWVEDCDTSTSPRPPLGPSRARGLGCGLCLGPHARVAAGSQGAQAAATAPSTQEAIPSEGGDREDPKQGQKAGAGGAGRKAVPPQVPALAQPQEGGSGSVSTHTPGALGSTTGLLHTDSSGQSQREHPASGAGSAPRRGGGGRTLLPRIPTKP